MAGTFSRTFGLRTATGLRRFLTLATASVMLVALLPFLADPALAAPAVLVVDDDGQATQADCNAATPAYSTVQAAVNDASPGDTVTVCPGSFPETVTVNKSLDLYGVRAGVDARDRSASETVLGSPDGGFAVMANNVTIDGFTISGVNSTAISSYQSGIWTTGGNHGLKVRNNIITGNIIGLYLQNDGTTQAVVERNWFHDNNEPGSAGGTAIYGGDSGDMDNVLIRNNLFEDNAGTLTVAAVPGSDHTGVTFTSNESKNDGAIYLLETTGAVISNNYIHGGSPLSPGTSGVSVASGNVNTSITGNTFENRPGSKAVRVEDDGYGFGPNSGTTVTYNHMVNWKHAVFVGPSDAHTGAVEAHYNRFANNSHEAVISNDDAVNAQNNWWGCSESPNVNFTDCDGVNVAYFNPWLVMDVSSDKDAVIPTETATITVDMTKDSNGNPSGGYVPDGTPVTFATTSGSVNPVSTTTTNGIATTTFTGGNSNGATITATVDNETDSVFVKEGTTDTVPPGGSATTDPGPGDTEPTPADPIQTTVTPPAGGQVSIVERMTDPAADEPGNPPTHIQGDHDGYTFLGTEVSISVTPDGTVANPIRLEFQLDASLLPPGTQPEDVQMFVDHTAPEDDPVFVPTCTQPNIAQAVPDPCVARRTAGPGTGDVTLVVYTSSASVWWFALPVNAVPCTITGTPGNDTLKGTGANDVICGLGGHDQIYGRGGDDVLYGGSGNDFLKGENGNDQVWGESGNDTLVGSNGADEMHGGAGHDELVGGQNADIMFGNAGNDHFLGGNGNESMYGGTGNDEAFGGEGEDYFEGNAGNDFLLGNAGADYLDGGDGDDRIFGGTDDDTAIGGDDEDQISVGEGDDIVDAGEGDNLVHTGTGQDTVTAGGGDDRILTGEDDDTVDAGDGDNRVSTQDGDDNITTGSGDDVIDAGEGDDNVFAGEGDNDVLLGGGNDYAVMGAGDDEVGAEKGNDQVDAGMGDNSVDGNEGNDQIAAGVLTGPGFGNCDFGPSFEPEDCGTPANPGEQSISGGGGKDFIATGRGNDHVLGDGGKDRISTFEGNDGIDGGTDDDYLNGGEGNNSILGGEGKDTIYTFTGNDQVLGDGGDDTITDNDDGSGSNAIDGGTGNDTIDMNNSAAPGTNDEILGGEGNDTITAGDGDDKLYGMEGNDQLNGEDGDDVIFGGLGNDHLDGGDALIGFINYDECYDNEGVNTFEPGTCDEGDGYGF